MKRYTLHFGTDEKIHKLEWADDKQPDLKWLQRAVGGNIEFVATALDMIVYADEEGLLKRPRLPRNEAVGRLLGREIVGSVIVLVGFGPAEEFDSIDPGTFGNEIDEATMIEEGELQ